MSKVKKCCMCGNPAQFIDKKNNEFLCRTHAVVNETIHRDKIRFGGRI